MAQWQSTHNSRSGVRILPLPPGGREEDANVIKAVIGVSVSMEVEVVVALRLFIENRFGRKTFGRQT